MQMGTQPTQPKVILAARVEPELLMRVTEAAAQDGRSVSNLVRNILVTFFDAQTNRRAA